MVRVRPTGLSLTETVIALFVITSGVLAIFNLYTQAMRYGQRAQERTLAITLAEAKMDELRGWAQLAASPGHNWDDWSGVVGASKDSEFPGYTINVSQQLLSLDSPNSQFELAFDASKRIQARNVRRVTVKVTWLHGEFSLTSLIAQPSLAWGEPALTIVPVGSVPSPVPPDTAVEFKVEAKDADDRAINDLTYTWNVVPKDGNGTVEQSRIGDTATFYNRVQLPGGDYVAPGGECVLEVRAVLCGVEQTATYELNTTAAAIPWSVP